MNILFNFDLEEAVKFVKKNGWKISEVPFIIGKECSPIGAYMIYKNLPYKEGTSIYANNCNAAIVAKALDVSELCIDSFHMGFYGAYGFDKNRKIDNFGFKFGVEFRKEIENV